MRYSRAWMLGVLVVLVVLVDILSFSRGLEDSFITLRYAKHFAEGFGIGAWNRVGPPVEGLSSLLWALVLGGLYKLGIPILTASKVIGIAAHIASLVVLFFFNRIARRSESGERGLATVFAAVFLAFSFPFTVYATTNTESTTFAFALLLAVVLSLRYAGRYSILEIVAFASVVLLRPEGFLAAGGIALFGLVRSWTSHEPLRPAVAKLGIVIGLVVALTAWRLLYFGHLLPTAYYAKGAGGWANIWLGVKYVFGFGINFDIPLLFIALLGVDLLRNREARTDAGVMLPLLLLAGWTLMVVKIGGDNPGAFPLWRHFVHVMPLIALTFGMGVERVFTGRRALQVSVLVLAVLLVNFQIGSTQGTKGIATRAVAVVRGDLSLSNFLSPDEPSPYLAWVRDTFPDDTLISTSRAGELPYYTDKVFIDALGLNDEYIARHGVSQPNAVDSKSDMNYVLSRRPDVIESFIRASDVLEGKTIVPSQVTWRTMEADMLANRAFKEEYLFVINAPYTPLERSLFIRRDFYERLANRTQLEVVPVTQTSLYGGSWRVSDKTAKSQSGVR